MLPDTETKLPQEIVAITRATLNRCNQGCESEDLGEIHLRGKTEELLIKQMGGHDS
jgi:hypothetical protein